MIISLIVTALLLYVAFNTTWDGDKFEIWQYCCIAALTLASWESAIVMLIISAWILYQGVRSREIRTLDWIESIIK